MSAPARINVLAAIIALREAVGYPPTHQEVADELGISKTTAFHHIARLMKEGYVTRVEGIPRSMVVTDAGREEVAQWT